MLGRQAGLRCRQLSARCRALSGLLPPGKPTLGALIVNSASQITVPFTNPAGTITSNNGRYRIGSGAWTTVTGISNPWAVSGLLQNTGYGFEVQAIGPGGTGDWSDESTATTLPAAPTIDSATPNSSTQITVAFTNPAGTILSNNGRYSDDGGETWTTATGIANPWVVTGLTQGTLYLFEVDAVGPGGEGAWSASASATTNFAPSTANMLEWSSADVTIYSDAGSTPCANGTTAQQWNNRSPSTGHFSQGTSANRPKFFTGQFFDLPGLQFFWDNTNVSHLDGADYAGGALAQPFARFLAFMPSRLDAGAQAIADVSATDFVGEALVGMAGTKKWLMYAGTNVTSADVQQEMDHVKVACAIFNGASSKLIFDLGQMQILAGDIGAGTPHNTELGGFFGNNSGYWGWLNENIFITGVPSAGVIAQNLQYLARRWQDANALRGYYFNGGVPGSLWMVQCWDGGIGQTWSVPEIQLAYSPAKGLRDPDIAYVAAQSNPWWVCYTNQANIPEKSTDFGVASAPVGGTNFTLVIDVDCTAVVGNNSGSQVWAPDWRKNVDGTNKLDGSTQWVTFAGYTGSGNRTSYRVSPGNSSDWSQAWTTPIANAGLPTVTDQHWIVYGGVDYMWLHNPTSGLLEVWTASGPTSTWSQLLSDPTGIGATGEAPSLTLVGGIWILTWDSGSGTNRQVQQAGAGDWTSGNTLPWSSAVAVTLKTSGNPGQADGLAVVFDGGTAPGISSCPTIGTITPGSGSLSVPFSGPSGNLSVTGYNGRYRENGTTTWTFVSSITSPWAISSLSHSTAYDVQVQAADGAGRGSWSLVNTATAA